MEILCAAKFLEDLIFVIFLLSCKKITANIFLNIYPRVIFSHFRFIIIHFRSSKQSVKADVIVIEGQRK